MLGFDSELADIVQDVFVGALSSIHTLKEPSRVEAWLASVAALTAQNVKRHRARRSWLRRFIDEDEERQLQPSVPAVEVDARLALGAFQTVLEQLPEEDRAVLGLRLFEGMELKEIARHDGVSLSTAKRRLARAEKRFEAHARRYPELRRWLRRCTRSELAAVS